MPVQPPKVGLAAHGSVRVRVGVYHCLVLRPSPIAVRVAFCRSPADRVVEVSRGARRSGSTLPYLQLLHTCTTDSTAASARALRSGEFSGVPSDGRVLSPSPRIPMRPGVSNQTNARTAGRFGASLLRQNTPPAPLGNGRCLKWCAGRGNVQVRRSREPLQWQTKTNRVRQEDPPRLLPGA